MIGGGGGTTTSSWSGGGGAGGYRVVTGASVATGTSNPVVIGAGVGAPQSLGGSTSALGYSVGGGGRGGPAHVSGTTAPQGCGGGGGGPDNGFPPWGVLVEWVEHMEPMVVLLVQTVKDLLQVEVVEV